MRLPAICPSIAATKAFMRLSPSIFKAYDIRGVVPSTLDETVARALGRAFGTKALAQGQSVLAVGRDGRLSGPSLSRALIEGLSQAGVAVIDVGAVTTPMLYFAASTLCASGIQVTGSHNPKDYNGFKMVMAGRAIYGQDIQDLRTMMQEESWSVAATPGRISQADVLPAYRQRTGHCAGSPDEDRGRQRQRHCRGLRAGHFQGSGLRGDRTVQRGRWPFSQPPP